MRLAPIIAAFLLAELIAPPALACREEYPPPAPTVAGWSHTPTSGDIRAGEVALEVSIVRETMLIDANDDETFLFTCGPHDILMRVERMLSGDLSQPAFVLVTGKYSYESGNRPITLVGQLTPIAPQHGNFVPDVDLTIPRLIPRFMPH